MPAIRVETPPQTGPVWWIPLGLLLLLAAAALLVLGRAAPAGPGRRLRRPADALSRMTGLPAWCCAAIAISVWSLAVAVIGFTWDVAWHADLGRDTALFTPPHTMILLGLAGIGVAALVAIALATADRAEVGLRVGVLRVPWSALPLGLMAAGAVVGFPLDDYWHSVYGIDVTMWSPTHLLMIGGASLTPIATWLMLAEARVDPGRGRWARQISESLAVSTLLGLSTFQLEFDLGIPQWQVLYHPALIALAMGVGLVAAREALGPGGALRACAGFLVIRGLLALLIGPVFGLSVERFPLYLGGALAVEAVFLAGAALAPMARVLLAGGVIGTAGLAVEWGWSQLWGLQPWQARLLPGWWVVIGLALVGAVLGSVLGRAVVHAHQVAHVWVAGGAFVAMVALLAVPFPRHGADATATISASPAGAPVPSITRDGRASFEQDITVRVQVSPAAAVESADLFRVVAWQGGQIINRPLRSIGGGAWVIDEPVPTGGTWKSLVLLEKGDAVAAAPVDFPADATYGLAPIPAPVAAPRSGPLEPASAYLTRESHGGSALPAILAYSALGVVAVGWAVALVGVGEAMRRRVTATLPLPGALRGAG